MEIPIPPPKPGEKFEVTEDDILKAKIAALQVEFNEFNFKPLLRDQAPDVEWYEYGGVVAAILSLISIISIIVSATLR